MKKGKIGIQTSMLSSKFRSIGIYETLRQCAELGYHCIEVSGVQLKPENVQEIKRACRDFDIQVAAASAFLETVHPAFGEENLMDNFDTIVNACHELNTRILRMAAIPPKYTEGNEGPLLEFCQKADVMCEKLRQHGIDLYYHNHHADFVKINGKYQLDILMENTQNLGFELDTYWIQAGGENPLNIIRHCAGRIRLLHLKDFRPVPLLEKDYFNDDAWLRLFQYAEVGEGNIPMAECIRAGLECGSEYFLVEQDETYGRDPLESLAISRKNLIAMGFGDWF